MVTVGNAFVGVGLVDESDRATKSSVSNVLADETKVTERAPNSPFGNMARSADGRSKGTRDVFLDGRVAVVT